MLEFKSITKYYNENLILNNLSFLINPGDKFLFFGDSGSGKTTILRLILGFEIPDSGNIIYKDKEINKNSLEKIRQEIAYVPQNLDIADGNINDFLHEIFSLKTMPDFDMRKFLDESRKWSIDEDFLAKDFEHLSGGEKQRLAIIIAILMERNIFILDEPTSSLDQKNKIKVRDRFLNMQDATVLVISHDEIWRNADIEIIDMEQK